MEISNYGTIGLFTTSGITITPAGAYTSNLTPTGAIWRDGRHARATYGTAIQAFKVDALKRRPK